jgi:5-(carboxyamino)imidazole ribonucleotide mutase
LAKICIVMGSKSDEEIAEKATKVLDDLGIGYEVHVASAHRDPEKGAGIVDSTDAEVFIGIAGLAAHLPGFIASRTEKPVIGVPVSGKLGGLDALLSIVQMPKGVPVATVGIDRGDNAALLAARILSVCA